MRRFFKHISYPVFLDRLPFRNPIDLALSLPRIQHASSHDDGWYVEEMWKGAARWRLEHGGDGFLKLLTIETPTRPGSAIYFFWKHGPLRGTSVMYELSPTGDLMKVGESRQKFAMDCLAEIQGRAFEDHPSVTTYHVDR